MAGCGATRVVDDFGSLTHDPEMEDPIVLRLLEALRTVAADQLHVYAHGEDERVTMAMTNGFVALTS